MKPIQIISQDVFDKIRSRFRHLEMGDETGAVTIDPAQARFFDFDFALEGNDLGRVSISLNDPGSLKIYYSQGITENQDTPAKQIWYRFLKEMRLFAMRRLLRFDTRDISKANLDRKDFQYLATKGTEDEEMTQMNESRWSQKSTRKTSRAVKGTTEVIVRHNHNVDEMYPGARSQKKNIKAIFIQNREGERFKYPFIHPAGAFAMAQHVDHGGVPHDPAGKAIMRMSERIAQLQEFHRQVQRSQLHDDAMGIANRAHSRLMELRTTIESLGKRHHYENWIAEFNETTDDDLDELDPVTMEEYKSKFTQTNFKEELAKFFPLIHKIMQETNAIDLEEYVGEGYSVVPDIDRERYTDLSDQGLEGPFRLKSGKVVYYDPSAGRYYDRDTDMYLSHDEYDEYQREGTDLMRSFEQWAEAVEQGKLTDDQITSLKSAIEDLQTPLDLVTAYNFFNEFGIEDSDLEDKFQQANELDPETDAMEVFQLWAKENYPELLVALGMSGTTAPQPAAESDDVPTDDASSAHDDSRPSMIKEVAKIVKQFYNKDNPEVGPFRGEEGILIDVEKQISEMFGEQAGYQARQLAEKFIEKLATEWQARHGDSASEADDGLARLKELASVVKTRIEGIRSHNAKEDAAQVDEIFVAPFYNQVTNAVKDREAAKQAEMERNRPKTPYEQGKEAKAKGEPYNNPYTFDPKAGADINYDHNSYRDGHNVTESNEIDVERILKLSGLAK